jgi:hypothetical protein
MNTEEFAEKAKEFTRQLNEFNQVLSDTWTTFIVRMFPSFKTILLSINGYLEKHADPRARLVGLQDGSGQQPVSDQARLAREGGRTCDASPVTARS